jgi:DNA (cytosine-5)-methyltransferase 1
LASKDDRDLWGEFIGIVRAVKPEWVLAENVPGLLSSESGRFFGRVLRDLAESGYDSEWDCLPACAFGAYHERDRVFVVAYAAGVNGQAWSVLEAGENWRSSLQSRRLHSMAVAERGKQASVRLEREPRLARLVHGVLDRTHRLDALGNAVVPQVAEFIGRRIMEIEGGAKW